MLLCTENKVEYSAFMVTNGYLLNENIIKKMLDANIKNCQITIDGPPEIHDKRRILKNGGGTFDVLLKNLLLLRSMGGAASIRVNIDKTNINYVEDLICILKENNLQDIHINFGQVTAYTNACNSIAGNCLSTEEYSKINIDMQKLLHKHGFVADEYPYYPGIKGNYCCADQINSYVVDPEGYLYKCWNSIGNIEEAVGNVLNIDNPSAEHVERNIEWVSTNPFEGECLECNLLPICMGGCPYLKIEDKKANCEKWKYNFDEVLKYTYEFKEQKN